MDQIERIFLKGPLLFDIVNLKVDIWRNTISM